MSNNNEKNNNLSKPQSEVKKFLFVSFESLSGDLAWKIKNEGHNVKIFIKNEADKDVYDGFLEKVDDWKKYKNNAFSENILYRDFAFCRG
jgi:hypothetical protein